MLVWNTVAWVIHVRGARNRARRRSEILHRAFELMLRDRAALAATISRENGKSLTDAAGEVSVQVPRDRAGSFEPVIVRKRQRRMTDVDALAIT